MGRRRVIGCVLALCTMRWLDGSPPRASLARTMPRLIHSQLFDKRDVMIPMRDGIKLHTEIYTPKHQDGPLPFIFERTPYGLHDDDKGYTTKFGIYQELVAEGFIFVFQDIRGRYGSEGQFVMFRDPRDKNDPHAIDEGYRHQRHRRMAA